MKRRRASTATKSSGNNTRVVPELGSPVPWMLPSTAGAELKQGSVRFTLKCQLCAPSQHVCPRKGNGRGWCDNCRKTKGVTPQRKGYGKGSSAHARHEGGPQGRSSMKKRRRGHWFLKEDGTPDLLDFNYDEKDKPDDLNAYGGS